MTESRADCVKRGVYADFVCTFIYNPAPYRDGLVWHGQTESRYINVDRGYSSQCSGHSAECGPVIHGNGSFVNRWIRVVRYETVHRRYVSKIRQKIKSIKQIIRNRFIVTIDRDDIPDVVLYLLDFEYILLKMLDMKRLVSIIIGAGREGSTTVIDVRCFCPDEGILAIW